MVAGVVAFVQLVAAAELAAHGIPDQLHQLDPLDRSVAVGAPDEAVEQGAHVGVLEVHRMGVQIDQRRAEVLLDDLLDPGVGDGREHAVGQAVLELGQDRSLVPRVGSPGHRVGDRPEQVAPGQHLADA